MLSTIRPALVLMLLFTLLTGLAYPLALTGLAGLILPGKAQGSLIEKDGRIIGSALIAQNFTAPQYFHPRPSAAGKDGFDAASSSGSNLAPTSKALVDRVTESVAAYRAENGGTGSVPADAVTTSGSGLDPHISPANARAQAKRVAAARQLPETEIIRLIEAQSEPAWQRFFGEPAVNVLLLNLALDDLKPMPR